MPAKNVKSLFNMAKEHLILTDLRLIHQDVDSLSQLKRESLTVRLGEVGST